MNIKKNCWEIMKCGRQPGGDRCDEHGVCPAAVDASCDGINHGKNAGRFCWAVAGTHCSGKVQGLFALKIEICVKCKVLQKVADEEGEEFILHKEEERIRQKRDEQSEVTPEKIEIP